MVFGLLAVESPWLVASVRVGECDGRRRNEGDAFVGWPEQHVVLDTRGNDCLRIEAAEIGERLSRSEQARVEEVGARASRLELELTEAKDTELEALSDEIGGHATGSCQRRTIAYPIVARLGSSMAIGLRSSASILPGMRIITLNANGIRSAGRKGMFDWIERQAPDVVCVQETKAQLDQLSEALYHPKGFHCYYYDAQQKGYSGVAIYAKRKPDRVVIGYGSREFDREGRYLEAQFGPLSVVSVYLPSGSSGEERQRAKFRFLDEFMPYLTTLKRKRRDYVLCGDWNIAHKELDLKNWRSNRKNSGFLPEERAWLDRLFGEVDYVDGFREINQEADQYTWWSNRGQAWAKNVGWRIDYQILSPRLRGSVLRADIFKQQRFSDHAPLIMDYDLKVR